MSRIIRQNAKNIVLYRDFIVQNHWYYCYFISDIRLRKVLLYGF